jgi:signal peptidase I
MTATKKELKRKAELPAAPEDGQPVQLAGKLRLWLWNETVRTVVYAVAIALVIRVILFEPFNIPSGSMKPTLLEGDFLFVSKYSYGYSRYSFPWGLAPFEGRIWESPVERGDVAVFREPSRLAEDYIKRIVGLPGDRMQVIAGVLHINGDPVGRERIEDYQLTDHYGNPNLVPQYLETLPNGRKHRILETSGDLGRLDSTVETVVPEGHYFAMGDNRDNSQDSRVIGFIPAENLVGRAEILFFSIENDIAWWQVWRWPGGIRYGRLLDFVE